MRGGVMQLHRWNLLDHPYAFRDDGKSYVPFGWVFGGAFEAVLVAGFIMGGMSNPLYALLIAYTNDYLEVDDMAAASGGLMFVNGVGAIIGPFVTGWLLSQLGPSGFWIFLLLTMVILAIYIVYRMRVRPSAYAAEDDYDAVAYAPVSPTGTMVGWEAAQEYYAENVDSDEDVEPEASEKLDKE